MEDLSIIIDIVSCSTAFMLGLLFITAKSNNNKANIFLGLFLWSLSAEVLETVTYGLFDDENLFFQELKVFRTTLFTLPFLLLYVNQSINSAFKKWYLLLFLPGIFYNIFYFLYEGIDIEIFKYAEYVFNIALLLYILNVLKIHKRNANAFYSDLEHKTLSWIKAIVFIFLGFHVLWIVEDIVGFQNEDYVQYFAIVSTISTLFMIYWIGHNGFSQPEIFKQRLFKINEVNTLEEKEAKQDSIAVKKFKNLRFQIQKEKLYTNSNLNLRTLSLTLNINEKELSRLINVYSGSNFYQFINRFRVDEFKLLLESPKAKQLSILGLAEEAGFSSKSTFYTAFKSLEGMTPKQYKSSFKKSE